MSTGDAIFMVVVVGVAVLVTILKDKVPAWLGFAAMLVASAVAIVGGAITGEFKVIPLGVAGVVGTIVAWVSGARSSVQADDDTLGGLAKNISLAPWLVIALVVAGAVGATFVIPDSAAKPDKAVTESRR
jgi:hypothetical protein